MLIATIDLSQLKIWDILNAQWITICDQPRLHAQPMLPIIEHPILIAKLGRPTTEKEISV